MDEEEQRRKLKADQVMAELVDDWPPMLYRFYMNCIGAGFVEERSYTLTLEFMKSLVVGGSPNE